MSARRRLAPAKRSSARAASSRARADGFERGAGVLVGGGERVLGFGQAVGGGAARRFGGFDLADQRGALLGERGGRIVEARALGRGFLDALFEGRELRGGAVPARVQPSRSEAICASRRAASSASRANACASARTSASMDALGLDLAAHRARAWSRSRRAGAAPRAPRSASLRAAFASSRLAARRRLGLGERRDAGGVAAGLALGIGVLLARGGGGMLQVAPPGAGIGFGLGGGAHLRFGGRDRRALGIDLGAHRLQLGFDVGEAVLAGEPAGGAGRRIGRDREAVPAPEVAVLGDEPLAGLEQRHEARRVGALDHADLREAARQFAAAP